MIRLRRTSDAGTLPSGAFSPTDQLSPIRTIDVQQTSQYRLTLQAAQSLTDLV